MGNNKYLDSIVKAALQENLEQRNNINRGHNLGERIPGGGIQKTAQEPLFYKHVVDIRDEPVSLDKFMNFDPNIRSTQGFFQITCHSKKSKRYVPGKPFFINQDLLRLSLHVSGKRGWHHLCSQIPELGWIERNSTLTDELFDVAANHSGVGFIFTVKWVEYSDMINKKAKERGIDIKGAPFVTYKCSDAVQEEYDKKYLLSPKKDWHELQPIIDAVDRDEEVKAEMNDNRARED